MCTLSQRLRNNNKEVFGALFVANFTWQHPESSTNHLPTGRGIHIVLVCVFPKSRSLISVVTYALLNCVL